MQSLVQERAIEQKAIACTHDELISFIQEVPIALQDAMSNFIEKHPNWDQYRLVQAAIAGYLLQKGVDSREINRIYFESMFSKKAFGKDLCI
tara:strand:- start:523 stop:798 length:276 start_codon:yes stop_codon:yes gene_type:complete